jgi:hypothetical protein
VKDKYNGPNIFTHHLTGIAVFITYTVLGFAQDRYAYLSSKKKNELDGIRGSCLTFAFKGWQQKQHYKTISIHQYNGASRLLFVLAALQVLMNKQTLTDHNKHEKN